MNRHLFLLSLSLLTASAVSGVTTGTLGEYTMTPEPGEYASIGEIKIDFPDTGFMGIDKPDCSGVTFAGDNGLTYEVAETIYKYGSYATMKFGIDSTPAEIKRPGRYTLTVPAGTFKQFLKPDKENAEIIAEYTVVNPDFDAMAAYSTTPEPEATITSFSSFIIQFPDADMGVRVLNTDGITLTADTSEGSDVYHAVGCKVNPDGKSASFGFAASADGEAMQFAASGKYTISIPEGAFGEDGSGYISKAVTVTFNIINPDENNLFDTYICTPASGSTVGELTNVEIDFPELAEARIQWPFDATRMTLQREGDEVIYVGNSPMMSEGHKLILGFSHRDAIYSEHLTFREAGHYTLTIPAGTLADDADLGMSNGEIVLTFEVDPSLNFKCAFSPDPTKVLSHLESISVLPDGVFKTIHVSDDTMDTPTMSDGTRSFSVTATEIEDGSVAFLMSAGGPLTPGTWTLSIPAHYLVGTNADGLEVSNPEALSVSYVVKEPMEYSFSTSPADNETVELFSQLTVAVEGNPRQVSINKEAGVPMIYGEGVEEEMNAAFSFTEVSFAPKSGAIITDGNYTAIIPAGFIVTTDDDGLTASLPEIKVTFSVKAQEIGSFDAGMFIFNEGWFGHDNASLTYVPSEGTPVYNAFTTVNPQYSLGAVGQYIAQYGGRIYLVCKQQAASTSGINGEILTAVDGNTLEYIGSTAGDSHGQGHAFCAVDATKGYLSTSSCILPIDLTDMTAGTPLSATSSFNLQYGEMLNYRGRVFATASDWDVVCIDPASDEMSTVETGPATTLFVTPSGNLWAATQNSNAEFVKIDPESLSTEPLDVTSEDGAKTRVADIWGVWRAAPLAVDLKDDVVYYAVSNEASAIGRLDLQTGDYDPEFISLPATETGKLILYGQGVSVDPASGDIVITATESGWGAHYKVNLIMRANPATGEIMDDKTVRLSEYYWFPAMTAFAGYEAPEITLEDISLCQDQTIVNLPEFTTLKQGNPYLVTYDVESSDPETVSVENTGWGIYSLSRVADAECDITVSASYQGLASTRTYHIGNSTSVDKISREDAVDVYGITGLLLVKDATPEIIKSLPAGIYIAGGKKIIVK